MAYKERIEYALAYIEDNLKALLCLSDLARAAGYSEYHFLRVFKQALRLTPADYIRKRRLSEIAREIAVSGRPVSDIAFEHGFKMGAFALTVYEHKEASPPKFWNLYNCKKLSLRLSGGKTVADYGVCLFCKHGAADMTLHRTA